MCILVSFSRTYPLLENSKRLSTFNKVARMKKMIVRFIVFGFFVSSLSMIGCTPNEQFFAEKSYLDASGQDPSDQNSPEFGYDGEDSIPPEQLGAPNAQAGQEIAAEEGITSQQPSDPTTEAIREIINAPSSDVAEMGLVYKEKITEFAMILDAQSALSINSLGLVAPSGSEIATAIAGKLDPAKIGSSSDLSLMCFNEFEVIENAPDSVIQSIVFGNDRASAILYFSQDLFIPLDLSKFKVYYREVLNVDAPYDGTTWCDKAFDEDYLHDVVASIAENKWIELSYNVIIPKIEQIAPEIIPEEVAQLAVMPEVVIAEPVAPAPAIIPEEVAQLAVMPEVVPVRAPASSEEEVVAAPVVAAPANGDSTSSSVIEESSSIEYSYDEEGVDDSLEDSFVQVSEEELEFSGSSAEADQFAISTERNNLACLKIKLLKTKHRHHGQGKAHWHIKKIKYSKKECNECLISLKANGLNWKLQWQEAKRAAYKSSSKDEFKKLFKESRHVAGPSCMSRLGRGFKK